MQTLTYSNHALGQMKERGASKHEVEQAILKGEKVPAKKGRHAYRLNFQYNNRWAGKYYSMKQVMPIVKEEENKFVIVTVYVFYF
ncbi:DUF4258 domain-containing protein [Candidatus Aerophobetes bacterium]|uniref:DUF4258 domain-containing protein n=1 Tax=Aerophobetes bacterium TaxID=2030807 RepID=A0A523RSU9_UNCAE|nr:MAG: DUF4258 domain-containing protein [Candidatus Aerophobetes bacterium]